MPRNSEIVGAAVEKLINGDELTSSDIGVIKRYVANGGLSHGVRELDGITEESTSDEARAAFATAFGISASSYLRVMEG